MQSKAMTNAGMLNLIDAIVNTAIYDYKQIIYRNNKGLSFSHKQYHELKEFFRSEYFIDLTGIHIGDKIVEHFEGQFTRPIPKLKYNTTWTDTMLDELVAMRESGMTFAAIGDIMHKSPHAVCVRYRRLCEEAE